VFSFLQYKLSWIGRCEKGLLPSRTSFHVLQLIW
jgi:hypothetical protein